MPTTRPTTNTVTGVRALLRTHRGDLAYLALLVALVTAEAVLTHTHSDDTTPFTTVVIAVWCVWLAHQLVTTITRLYCAATTVKESQR